MLCFKTSAAVQIHPSLQDGWLHCLSNNARCYWADIRWALSTPPHRPLLLIGEVDTSIPQHHQNKLATEATLSPATAGMQTLTGLDKYHTLEELCSLSTPLHGDINSM
eukprot:TRINITY_DN3261_c0_g1_i2.p1 TRINITY_DN3261_c0_g1~~TRINITY_DN3261_c0_g1_i2.p1  ORF type:complete len:108 (+),score=9.43 TRINITY_DN3261_c0_g1_i2:317-640(+)